MNLNHLYRTLPLPKFSHLPVALQTTNVGDDIQIECANRLWNVHSYVDRDNFNEWTEEAVIPFIGWYGYDTFVNPPKSQCILLSLHFSMSARKNILNNKRFLDWFKDTAKNQNFPVYARDISTRDWLRNLNIECEFGGCITSTLPEYTGERSGVISIDAPNGIFNVNEKFSNAIPQLKTYSAEQRLAAASNILDKIQKAELVHTSRLHIALPCRAMRTPFSFYEINLFEKHRLSGHDLLSL
jgi:hypothetical protein